MRVKKGFKDSRGRGVEGEKPVTRHLSLVTVILLFTFNFSLLTSHFSLASAADTKDRLKEVEEKLREKKQEVKKVIEQEKSILSEMEDINKNIKKKQKELKNYDARIAHTQSEITALQDEIGSLTCKLKQRREHLKERLKALYKQRRDGGSLILLTATDYSDLIKKTKFLGLVAHRDNKLLKTFSNEINESNLKKQNLEALQKDLELSKNNVREKTKEMQAERDKRDSLLASVRSQKSSYEKMIKELEESSEKLRQMMERLEKQETPEAAADKGFAALKGRLPWPVGGEVVVPFGKYNDPQYNIAVFKNGIELRAGKGDEPKAVAEGKVVYADWFKGYGLLLIINHGSGYHSLYGHLSEIFHDTGDIIKKGNVVGKIGESGLSNSPTLYFEIRHKGKPVDPMQWLKRTNNNKKNR
ncbi:MAG: peptidoglycan DD-metalloendopeptidase family protein [Nitrospirae bacterium]|nr:peptidoglycan DD-metalloendopeptidase family protein [Nitrospirota bacterium]